MGDPPAYSLFDDDDDPATQVDQSFWKTPDIPAYPALARFGRFEILGRIGRGGMAEIYLARERADDGTVRHVVVKRILRDMQDNQQLLGMFLEEGATATRLYHPNVCHVYECGEIEGVTFMALEWVFGRALSDIIERATARGIVIPWPVGVQLIAEIAAALQYVHHAKGVTGRALNIVHRDVSPHNVMVSWDGQVKLLDFGIAKTGGKDDGGTKGKYAYMSPEQARSQPVDHRSDLFALGICLYEVLAGRPLYERGTLLDTLSAIVREPPPSIVEARPDLPPALDRILARALAKDPSQRFQSAGELQAALQQVLRTQGQVVTGQRLALFLGGLFDLKEKLPMPPNHAQVTGSFAPIDGVDQPVVQEITFERFVQHEDDAALTPGPAPTPIVSPAIRTRSSAGRNVALWIAVVAGMVLFASLGVAAALHLLR